MCTKLPFKGGRVEFTLLFELLEEPGLYESAPPCHHCYALVLIHAPSSLQASTVQLMQSCLVNLSVSMSSTCTSLDLLLKV